MNRVFVALILSVLLSVPTLASAQLGPGPGTGSGTGPGMYYGRGPGSWISYLNLTPDQMQKLETIHMNFFKDTIPQRNQLMLARMELRSLWSQLNPDPAAVLAKQRQINGLRDQIVETAVKYRLEARKVFTPEQLSKIQAMKWRFGHGFGRWSHYRHGMGPGAGIGGQGCGFGMGMGNQRMGRGHGMGAHARGCPCGSGRM